jgi:hypothetical protein
VNPRWRDCLATALASAVLLTLFGGCALGPKALEQTHGRYSEAIRQVEEEQLLRNLVHLRYHEPPVALNVASIAAQYELSAGAEARPFFIAPNPSNSNVIFRTFTAILPDATVSGSNRPTITLDPATDSAAVRQFLTPIPHETLTFLVQSGWPVSALMRLWVERLNGVPNAVTAGGPACEEISDFGRFQRAAELLQLAQDQELGAVRSEERVTEVSGPLPATAVTAAAAVDAAKNGLEYRPRSDDNAWTLIRRDRRLVFEITPGAENSPVLIELFQLLNLLPGQSRYDLTQGTRGAPDPLRHPSPPSAEVRVVTRSTAQVYSYLANGVEVPAAHLNCGLVQPPVDAAGRPFDGREVTRGLFEVHAWKGHCAPPYAYAAVKYRGWWYYLDDRDQPSKATLALMLQLSRLDFGRRKDGAAPVLTLPVGR